MNRFLRFFRPRPLAGAIILALGIAAGCTYTHGDPAPQAGPDPTCTNATAALATYRDVISPIFDQHCRSCHGAMYNTPGNPNSYGGGIPFRTHQEIKNYGDINYLVCCIEQVGSCDKMPKIGNKLSDCDIARIKAWVAAGEPDN